MSNESRRAFLKKIGVGTGAYLADAHIVKLLEGAVRFEMNKAHAQTTGVMPKRYINILLNNAPPRWFFDQWLTPFMSNPSVNFAPGQNGWTPGVANYIDGSGNLLYKTFQHNYVDYTGANKTINLPHLLNGNILAGNPSTTLSTSLQPITSLLKNMAVIQGYNSRTDGHEVNGPLQLLPDPAVPSINGAVADLRSDPISAIASQHIRYGYKSGKSRAVSIFNSGTNANGGSLAEIMAPFKKETYSSSVFQNVSSYSDYRQTITDIFKSIMSGYDANATSLGDNNNSARVLAATGLTDPTQITAKWNELYLKYATAMNSSMNIKDSRFAVRGVGHTDPSTGSPTASPIYIGEHSTTMEGNPLANNYDLMNLINHVDHTSDSPISVTNSNYAGCNTQDNSVGTMMGQDLISSFALIEYAIVNNICGSIVGGSNSSLTNMKNSASSIMKNSFTHDVHNTNMHTNIVIYSSWYKGFFAGLITLIQALKAANMFEDTVIHITSDFGRNPRYEPGLTSDTIPQSIIRSSGSDHGWQGHCTCVISGAFENGPIVVGNIERDGSGIGTSYYGTWGYGAPVDFNGTNEILSPRHAAAAVTHLLGVSPNPWPFTHLVWRYANGILQPTVEQTTIKVS